MGANLKTAIGFLLTTCLLALFASSTSAGKTESRLTRLQIKEAETRLSELGYWTGKLDGLFDQASRSALIAFQKWELRSVTGEVTMVELEALRNSVPPRPREPGYEHVEVDLDRQVLLIVGPAGNVRVLPVSTGTNNTFMNEGQESIAYTPRGRFVVYDKTFGWENGALGSVYYANYISGGVAIHGSLDVPTRPASHGCIRIPMFAAREVSKLMTIGTIVLVYDKVSFVSGKEWASNPKLKEAAMLNNSIIDYDYSPEMNKPKIGSDKITKARLKTIRAD
ncbi:MAG: hypothetical protein C5B55_13520 [Blastocatellia bacterium]|nr:MAG: hypothetical protein C5B55_13520 [Blastocatellia bacterium]